MRPVVAGRRPSSRGMTNTFVWFHNHNEKPADATKFYEKLLSWKPSEGPPGMTMLAAGAAPVARPGALDGGAPRWGPVVPGHDVPAGAQRAARTGATPLK